MNTLRVHRLGERPYLPVWRAMRLHAAERGPHTPDQLWCVQHPPVYTQGRNGGAEHLLDPGSVPVIAIDRGGQVTWHGPGQLVVYTLLDLRRRGLGVRALVERLEQAVIDALGEWGIVAGRREGAPGVYTGDAKIAALGLRVRHGVSIHGLALNVDPALSAFGRIHPCGYAGLATTSVAAEGGPANPERVRRVLLRALAVQLATGGQETPSACEEVPTLPPELLRCLARPLAPAA
ncbi:lipoyl(octanoyl) transferase LipB [Thioalkalivibrio sp. ALE21]|uniref:lipoyl(octanoyl) transferase LipB n=1 Tax=Thioalkalivibrio sp. ALE21 TaxID=1158175 RepID=UPI001443C3BC|nr:lipoyl(octanoyl) transferase LipB [Thioalkalivibrio sp. ALE21]